MRVPMPPVSRLAVPSADVVRQDDAVFAAKLVHHALYYVHALTVGRHINVR